MVQHTGRSVCSPGQSGCTYASAIAPTPSPTPSPTQATATTTTTTTTAPTTTTTTSTTEVPYLNQEWGSCDLTTLMKLDDGSLCSSSSESSEKCGPNTCSCANVPHSGKMLISGDGALGYHGPGGDYPFMFYGGKCARPLKEVQFTGNVTQILYYSFHDTQITSLRIPDSVTQLGGSITPKTMTCVYIGSGITSAAQINSKAFSKSQLTCLDGHPGLTNAMVQHTGRSVCSPGQSGCTYASVIDPTSPKPNPTQAAGF